ncbi:hypothetical protein PAAL66ix_14536 [Paenibacillus alvei A6-6i-x]|nr:hypothetical protein PAAL66ix_14536 [Paenibacillus alvei A6-6i-x]
MRLGSQGFPPDSLPRHHADGSSTIRLRSVNTMLSDVDISLEWPKYCFYFNLPLLLLHQFVY